MKDKTILQGDIIMRQEGNFGEILIHVKGMNDDLDGMVLWGWWDACGSQAKLGEVTLRGSWLGWNWVSVWAEEGRDQGWVSEWVEVTWVVCFLLAWSAKDRRLMIYIFIYIYDTDNTQPTNIWCFLLAMRRCNSYTLGNSSMVPHLRDLWHYEN